MPPSDADEFSEIEQRMNIHRLKNEAKDLAGGEMTSHESPDAPPEILEAFWQNVVNFERAPVSTLQKEAEKDGFSLPHADELNDAQIAEKLWETIAWLAKRRVYLEQTNHLSDRELFVWLREDAFQEQMTMMPGMNCHTSPIGSCDDEDMLIHFRYYADEEEREMWLKDWPDYEMPERIEPPFSRDHLLPQADYSLGHEEDFDFEDDEEWEEPDFSDPFGDEDNAPEK